MIDDLYVRVFRNDSKPRRSTVPKPGRIARIADRAPDRRDPSDPPPPDAGTVPARRARLALAAARSELEARKRALAVLTYDDLLVRLRDTLLGVPPATARPSHACARATGSC